MFAQDLILFLFFTSRRRHTRCALVTGVHTCALPISRNPLNPALVGNKFPRVPKWRANASVRYSPSEDWSLAANFRHQSTPDRNIEKNSTSLCDTFYCVSTFSFVDLKATKRFGAFALSAGLDNLPDEKAFVQRKRVV